MKGIILAAGKGTRLKPLTDLFPKCLLPVYDEPMICYPLEKLIEAGINEVLVIVRPEEEYLFRKALDNNYRNVKITYAYQYKQKGTADAINIARKYAGNDNVALIFGDNIFDNSIKSSVENFKEGAHLFLRSVQDPERYGIAEIDGEKIKSIEEKPKSPKTNYAVIGCYLYDNTVFEHVKTLKPSSRGELEITDLNNIYAKNNQATYTILNNFWIDAGTVDALVTANLWMKNKTKYPGK
ncbi:NTP transferase domain-containing protein [Candidatus Woesearchaeota archaeon]|nr:NTP transferase domain-containing protein [Candidatus Woesearchaeota archaeon]